MKLTHTIEGEGSDVILLHGFPSNMYFWDEIKNELLKNNKRVTVPEQRGYPLSEIKDSLISDFNIKSLALDIEELVEELGLDKELIVVGHDWGSIHNIFVFLYPTLNSKVDHYHLFRYRT